MNTLEGLLKETAILREQIEDMATSLRLPRPLSRSVLYDWIAEMRATAHLIQAEIEGIERSIVPYPSRVKEAHP